MWYATHFAHLQCLIFGCYILKLDLDAAAWQTCGGETGVLGQLGDDLAQVAQPTTSQNDGMGESRGGRDSQMSSGVVMQEEK
jgi:hypothetical protein